MHGGHTMQILEWKLSAQTEGKVKLFYFVILEKMKDASPEKDDASLH